MAVTQAVQAGNESGGTTPLEKPTSAGKSGVKDCIYCGQPIATLARKCNYCQSFQDPKDAPKQSFDLATLVISFVGQLPG
jgi:hypothetical protein